MSRPSALRARVEYGAVRGLEWVLTHVPLSWSAFCARRLGDLVHLFLRSRVREARERVRTALGPELDDHQIAGIVRESVRHFALVPVELMNLSRAVEQRGAEGVIEIQGRENLERVRASGRGCLFLTGHVGNWEVIGALCRDLGYPMLSVARALDNPLLERWLLQRRTQFGQQITAKRGASREVVRALREGYGVGMLLDQHAGRHGLRVPFFGKLASTYPSAAHLARRLRVPLLTGLSYRRGGPLDFVLEFGPPIESDPDLPEGEDHFRMTCAYTRALEDLVRRHPEQYLWLHRRWRSGGEEPQSAWLRRYAAEPAPLHSTTGSEDDS